MSANTHTHTHAHVVNQFCYFVWLALLMYCTYGLDLFLLQLQCFTAIIIKCCNSTKKTDTIQLKTATDMRKWHFCTTRTKYKQQKKNKALRVNNRMEVNEKLFMYYRWKCRIHIRFEICACV